MSIPQELLQEFNKKYFKRNYDYYKLSELNIAFKYLKVYPLGGGFQTTIKLDDYFFNKLSEGEYLFTNEIPQLMEAGKFGFECWQGEFVKGWHKPFDRWNGWRMPWLTLTQIEKFNNLQNKYFQKEPCPRFQLLSGKVFWKDPNDDEETQEIKPIIYNLGGWDQTPLYDVSLGLTWDLYDDEGNIL